MALLLLILGLIFLTIYIVKYPELSLVFLFSAGFLKVILLLQYSFFRIFDLTVLSEIFVLAAMIYGYAKNKCKITDIISFPLILYLFLGFLLLFGAITTSAPIYGFQKSTRFMTFGLTCFLAPVVFGNSFKNIKVMVMILVGLGVIFSIGTIISPDISYSLEDTPGRASFIGNNPLSVATSAGMAIVICFCFAIMTYRAMTFRILYMVLITVMCIALIITGSRGPFLGVIITGLLTLIVCGKGTSKVWMFFIMVAAIVGMAIIFIRLPQERTERITSMWQGTYEATKAAESRTELFIWTFEKGFERPVFGHGTGSFAVDRGGQDKMDYPHNMILEAFYEQGLLGVIIVTVFLVVVFKRWRKARRLVRYLEVDISTFEIVQITGLLFVFLFIQAMKSGDLNGNRTMFFAAGLIVATLKCLNSIKDNILTSPEPSMQVEEYCEVFDEQWG